VYFSFVPVWNIIAPLGLIYLQKCEDKVELQIQRNIDVFYTLQKS
jgi:hypothetical protein